MGLCADKVYLGPPGRGKTTTIAAAASEWDLANMSVWICAHSNVAVKNLAEALFKRGVPFKIIVSKDFYVEWCALKIFHLTLK